MRVKVTGVPASLAAGVGSHRNNSHRKSSEHNKHAVTRALADEKDELNTRNEGRTELLLEDLVEQAETSSCEDVGLSAKYCDNTIQKLLKLICCKQRENRKKRDEAS